MPNRLLELYRRMRRWPGGSWLFSRAVCFRAPYFSSIAPRVAVLEPCRCEAVMEHRRRVTNHLGTVHAIALCNLAELAAGLMAEASLPAGMRWIPRGMEVEYLRKARGRMHAIATPDRPPAESAAPYDLPVTVQVRDPGGGVVFRAVIRLHVSPRPPGRG